MLQCQVDIDSSKKSALAAHCGSNKVARTNSRSTNSNEKPIRVDKLSLDVGVDVGIGFGFGGVVGGAVDVGVFVVGVVGGGVGVVGGGVGVVGVVGVGGVVVGVVGGGVGVVGGGVVVVGVVGVGVVVGGGVVGVGVVAVAVADVVEVGVAGGVGVGVVGSGGGVGMGVIVEVGGGEVVVVGAAAVGGVVAVTGCIGTDSGSFDDCEGSVGAVTITTASFSGSRLTFSSTKRVCLLMITILRMVRVVSLRGTCICCKEVLFLNSIFSRDARFFSSNSFCCC
jgi:hypothetical protein